MQEVADAIKMELARCAQEAGLKSFEQVNLLYNDDITMTSSCILPQAKVVKIQSEQFTVENGLLTPTFKLRRPAFRRQFSESVIEMYSSLTHSMAQAARSS